MTEPADGQPEVQAPAAEEACTPRLTALLFCDYASQSVDGKYNLLGIFDRIFIGGRPPIMPTYNAYIRLAGMSAGPMEVLGFDPDGSLGMRYRFTVEMTDPGGLTLGRLN